MIDHTTTEKKGVKCKFKKNIYIKKKENKTI